MRRFGEMVRRLRGRVVAAMHAGHLGPGDRLPSVRELAAELGEDPRSVLRAYRVLEAEGLVEIRTRSGVYLARQEEVAPAIDVETSRWVAEAVLTEAWRRRIPIPELPDFIRRCTATVRVRCACVDAVEDHRVALCHELREDFGYDTWPVPLHASAAQEPELREADLIATTTFCAAAARSLASRAGKPLVVVKINPFVREEIERLRPRGPINFLVLDPAFEERIRMVFGEDARVVAAGDRSALEALDVEGPLVVSRAAALRLGGDALPSCILLRTPAVSPETARELAGWLLEFNLRALEQAAGSASCT